MMLQSVWSRWNNLEIFYQSCFHHLHRSARHRLNDFYNRYPKYFSIIFSSMPNGRCWSVWFFLEYFHKPILTTIDSKTKWQLQPNLKTFHKVCLHSFFYQRKNDDDDDGVINSNMYRWRHFLNFNYFIMKLILHILHILYFFFFVTYAFSIFLS